LSREDQEFCDVAALSSFLNSLKRVEVQSLGSLSRNRIEQATASLIDDRQYLPAVGKQLVIIRGKPGTGKTVKLLRLAHHLARHEGARVRILTYNLALVSDIRRLVALTGINDETSGLIDISSLDKFFYELIIVSGLTAFDYDKYLEQKSEMIQEIQDAIDVGLASEADVLHWLEKPELRFDYVLIDEGQDWAESEQRLLVSVFGPERVVVGDGLDQMIRCQVRSDWSLQAESKRVLRVPAEKRCLRQKHNLNEFNRALSHATGRPWELESRTEFSGGRVIIAASGYSRSLHASLWEDCQQDGNRGYEMLFMVPPRMASGINGHGFQRKQEFETWGMRLWDGTQRDNRREFPTDPLEHRVVQYESCRGLEAWIAVCLGIDEIFALKRENWQRHQDSTSLEDEEISRCRFAYQWCMIPLTRAIDTTVITLTDLDSEFSRMILRVAESAPDLAQVV
jgi:hypothetical protein